MFAIRLVVPFRLGQFFEPRGREDDCAAGTATIFTYDKAGNITAKYIFPWVDAPTGLLMGNVSGPEDAASNYTYSSSAWGDLLTGYNGTTINYDDIGNPTNWRNARIMMWDGKQLTAFTRDALNHSLSFSYNADGIRTRKTNSDYIGGQQVNDAHDYVLDGTNIVRELITHTVGTGSSTTTTTKTLYYLYDASGSVAGLIYNGNVYYFQKNIQGDIIRICNAGGDTVVEYTYDAWGKVLSVTGTMASTLGQDNPFRYRGYYYDTETGFYYLQTRYYDPEVGRFLNADVIIGANGDIEGYNSFAYCSNNPIIAKDSFGNACVTCLGETIGHVLPWFGAGGGGGTIGAICRIVNTTNFILKKINAYTNKKADKDAKTATKGQIIRNQKSTIGNSFMYGAFQVSYNGCEVIAVHNAKVLLHLDSTLSQTITDFQNADAMMAFGHLGSNPWSIGRVLSNNGIEWTSVSLRGMTSPGVYIISYWLSDNISDGLHTIAIRYDGSIYTAYNYCGGENPINLSDHSKGFICGYYLGNI